MKLDVVHWLQPNVDSEVPELRYQQQGVDDEQNAHQPFTQSALDMHSVALSTTLPQTPCCILAISVCLCPKADGSTRLRNHVNFSDHFRRQAGLPECLSIFHSLFQRTAFGNEWHKFFCKRGCPFVTITTVSKHWRKSGSKYLMRVFQWFIKIAFTVAE